MTLSFMEKKKADCMRWLKVLALALVASAGFSLFFTARRGVESDLFALVDSVAGSEEIKSVASAMARSARFLVRADSEEAARNRLASLGALNANSSTFDHKLSTTNCQLSTLLKSLAPYARCFLSPETRTLLENGEFVAVRDSAVARLYSPMPPVLPPSSDPFLLFTDYVLNLSVPRGEWIAVNVELLPSEAFAALAAVKGADDVRCAGAPFHTAVASERSKREINILSGISIFCVVLFGWLLTRSFRFLPVLGSTLVAAFCVATAALFAVFPKPHLMTFVFGTSLIGLSVDYIYHAWTSRNAIMKPLTFSFLSTVACFLPLFFSGIGVLSQMALFTVMGLATVYAGVLAFGRGKESVERVSEKVTPREGGLFSLLATCVLFALCIAGVLQVRFDNDLSRFHRPDPYLAEGERIATEMSGGEGFVPSVSTQLGNAELVRRLYATEGKNYCDMTGLPLSLLKLPSTDVPFDPKGELANVFARLARKLRGLMLLSFGAMAVLFLPLLLLPSASRGRGAAVCFLSASAAAFATVGLLGWMGEPITFFNLLCVFIFFGLGLDYSIFCWHSRHRSCGSHSLSHTESLEAALTGRAVRYSFLTSFVGFGLLAFTDFAVTRSMGITLAAGLAFSYLSAKTFCGGNRETPVRSAGKADPLSAANWHEQREQCASTFWVQFMWYSYAWLGKTFQKAIFVVGMPVIYFFSRPARVALARFYGILSSYTGKPLRATHGRLFRHILGFAWGLMDKTDACTLKKNLPQMDVRDDEGWRAFKGLVDSGKGAFLLCTHVGMIGVLPALPDAMRRWKTRLGRRDVGLRIPKVHAFQQMGHDAVFMTMFMKHFDHTRLELHAVEEIGVETAVAMQEAIRRGELVIMAGDRTSAGSKSVLKHRFLGRECVWPKGAFKFAELMEAPVFGVTCVCTGWNRYDVHVAALGATCGREGTQSTRRIDAFLSDYVAFLESETLAYPDQWYQFYDFFR